MFQPFDNYNQFYAGLILWCDPNCHEMDTSTLTQEELHDRKKARELKPCLVVAVNHTTRQIQVARICATTPTDTQRWVRIDSSPPITWRISDAWIWVGTPPTVPMTLQNHKVMHPHKHTQYTGGDIAAANLQNYWVHRQNYLAWRQMSMQSGMPSTSSGGRQISSSSPGSQRLARHTSMQRTFPNTETRHTLYSTGAQAVHHRDTNPATSQAPATYPPHTTYNTQSPGGSSSFTAVSPHPVVVPPGFTESHPSSPGWWRNPETGWFWSSSRGLVPPAP
ncbi:hypothetical protein R3P38DRAFT_1661216 [Favolaschia claudopus]|uniref:Uncharacterized protein n=1 Tax=Favolaschia claudopus TaxID=2862362 RepID=A0AAW0AGC4_9AGAR